MRRARESAVVFDLDGVLVDSRLAIAGCINHALLAHGLPQRDEEDLHGFIGPPLTLAFAELTAQASDSRLVADCVQTYRTRYADVSLRDTRVVAGIPAALDSLAARHRLAVATSKPLAFAEPLLQTLGLRDYFETVSGPDLDAATEDKAATIATALQTLLAPAALMVGDRSFDIVGAHNNRLAAIGVTWGIADANELRSAGADAIIDTPHDLLPTVNRLLHRPA